ncbi:putative F420-dependent oxidoreductase [Saccharopolyspora erythraea NRRL 2338]|uniref:Possible hydride transferase n=2 Tax=Saccharopolyspora erythraea TaxID=1836 RepID=A4FDN6_SACEN|nr:TIGR03619 family F420-dependent LLM class oxidoreductase [Saccharopolyspora erythraea]EQD85697.1 hydride transferase [Saccharopolyspora erythraea D]PFG95896.1 putative F420-dependent oxidoreductase [Saccharopolyspora erythraea NRRL 2338]QRK92469.1 TIGR03619 family F420-dependent LLM class oxidoreductase [Saccharopolyspora erythraea]CAM02161.1 possible hydride transferase [Saccharopolyspora erythraea NRRL 2338]
MRIGFSLPQLGTLAHQAADIASFAREAEALGAGSLWVGDRLLAPVEPTVGYPPGADTIPDEFHRILDPFAMLTVAATATENVLLGSNVLNAPWYPPALLARSLTTIDVVSRGRLVPGFGVGWSPEEFQAAGIPMKERGARMDECLEALKQLWTADVAEYGGRHWQVPPTHAYLKPVQRPHPPIYIGGFAPASMRRVAQRGDGWLPILPVPGDVDPAMAITAPMSQIRQLAEEEGRDPGAIDLILRVYPDQTATIDQVVTAIGRAVEEAGVEHLLVDLMFLAKSIDHTLEMADTILRRV